MTAMITLLVRRKLIIALMLAIVVRLLALAIFAPTLDFEREGNAIHGSESYDLYARNLLETGVYGLQAGVSDAILPPVYSYTLAGVYGVLGRGFVQVGLYHIALDVLAMVLLYHISVRIFSPSGTWRGDWVGVLAVLGYAFYPYLLFQNLTTTDTGLWIVQMHAYILLMVLIRQRPHFDRLTWLYVLMAGLVLGIATMTRPITPFLAILTGLWLLTRLSVWQMVTRLLPVAVLSVALIVPWMVRNYAIYDDFVTMTITSGGNLWQGNNPWTVPVFMAGYDVQWTPVPQDVKALPPLEEDKAYLALGVDYWRTLAQDDPLALVELFWVKFRVHWSIPIAPLYNPQPNEQWRLEDGVLVVFVADEDKIGLSEANISYDSGLMATLGRPLHTLYFGALFVMALVGMGAGLRQAEARRALLLVIAVQLSMTITYMIFHPSTRYRSPTDPMLFVASAYGALWLWHHWRAWRTRAA